MPIYDKSVRLLVKDFVKQGGFGAGQLIPRSQIVTWFRANYSKIKMGTISAHLIKMSTNAPSRIHYNVNPAGEDDLFFQVDGSHFRLYEPASDPAPIYEKPPVMLPLSEAGNGRDAIDDEKEQAAGFAYESDLRDFLARNLVIIEPGLRLYEDEGISGIEFPVGGRFIDILALDKNNNYVVIELKVSVGYDRVVGQLLRYMGWIEANQAEASQKVRGIIIAREISADLRLATSRALDIELFEYDLSVALRKIEPVRTRPALLVP